MARPDRHEDSDGRAALLSERGKRTRGGVGEVLGFLRASAKWWLPPLIVCLLLIGLALVLGGTAAGPFVYTVF